MKVNLMTNKKFPIGVVLFAIGILIASVAVYIDPYLMQIFGMMKVDNKVVYFWTHLTTDYVHAYSPIWMRFAHILTNLSILFIFGTMFERRFGSDLFVITYMLAFLTDAILPELHPTAEAHIVAVGASGILYAFIPLGILSYLLYLKENNFNPFKRWTTWILGIYSLLVLFVPTVVSDVIGGGNGTTTMCHIVSVLTGLLVMAYCLVRKPAPKRSFLVCLLALPDLLIAVLLVLYKVGIIFPIFR